MFTIKYPWKEFKIHLPDLDQVFRSYQYYVGNSAGTSLELHFSQEPSQQVKDLVQMHMDSLTQSGEESKIVQYNHRNQALDQAKTEMLSSDILTWIPAERKIFMGLPLTNDDLDALVAKYPQG